MRKIYAVASIVGLFIFGCQSNITKTSSTAGTSRNVAQEKTNSITDLPAFADADSVTKNAAVEIAEFQKDVVSNDRAKDPEKVARRDTHSKQHGCLRAVFKVNDDIPVPYRTSLFIPGRSYKTWIRLANGLNGIHHDLAPDARAMSLKLMGVRGDKVLGGLSDEEHYTQDFIMNNYPAFFVDGPEDSYEFFKDVHDNKPQKFFIPALWTKDRKRELFQTVNIQSKIEANLMAATYWTGTAFRHGSLIGKYMAKPCAGFVDERVKPVPTSAMSAQDKAWIAYTTGVYQKYNPMSGSAPEFNGPPWFFLTKAQGILKKFLSVEPTLSKRSFNYLTDSLRDYLSSDKGGCFDFGVQLYKNDTETPIEHPSMIWFPSQAPFVPLARIQIPKQTDFADPQNNSFCEDLSFTVWHAVEDHKPLGKLNQMRGIIYHELSQYRHGLNGRPRGEPLDNFERTLVSPEQAAEYYGTK